MIEADDPSDMWPEQTDDKELDKLLKMMRAHFANEHPDPDQTLPCKYLDDIENEIQALIHQQVREARLRGVEEVLLRLKSVPPVDWIDAQTWIDSEYLRLQARLKELKEENENGNS